MQVNLTVGDWSDDGHGKTRTYTIEHNLSNSELADAYVAGSKKLNYVVDDELSIDVMQYVADGYEERIIPTELALKLTKHGIRPAIWDIDHWAQETDEELYEFNGDEYTVNGAEGFANLWLRIAQLGDPNLRYKHVNEHSFCIGGYGCL